MVAFGRRIRKGAAGTAVAAAAMAALTASQAPGLAMSTSHHLTVDATPPGAQIDGGSPDYFTALPPLAASGTPDTPGPGTRVPLVTGPDTSGVPVTVLAAYRNAERILSGTRPDCHLPWQLLAAIGQVESGQADGGAVDLAGNTTRRILGPVLNGDGYADITDTDGGAYDGDPVHDRAVGPMQFIPSTWRTWGADGNKDGKDDPNNIYDAALAAGDYLCAVGGDLSQMANIRRAILGYNHSDAYLRTVLTWFDYFRDHATSVPDRTIGAGITAPHDTASASPSPTGSPTPEASPTPTRSAHPSASADADPSASASPSPTATASAPASPTPTASASPSASPSDSPSASPSDSPTASPSPTDTPTGCPTPTDSATPTPTAAPDPTDTDTPSASPTDTCSPTPTPSATPSTTPTDSPTATP